MIVAGAGLLADGPSYSEPMQEDHVEEYYARAASGTLAPLSFVDPSFANEGGGTSGDEHPHGDIRAGQTYMSDIVHAFISSAALHWAQWFAQPRSPNPSACAARPAP